MSYHLGEEFEGIISGVTGWGLYVELPNTVEGLVHVNTLRDDYYVFDQESYELCGEMTRKRSRKMTDPVAVVSTSKNMTQESKSISKPVKAQR